MDDNRKHEMEQPHIDETIAAADKVEQEQSVPITSKDDAPIDPVISAQEADAIVPEQAEHEDNLQAGSVCIICKRAKSEGMRICEEFICLDCEEDIVHTDVSDAKYPFYVMQMKQIWYQKNA